MIEDLRVTVTVTGNGIYTDSTIGHVTLDNVVSTANASYGLEIHNSAVVTDLVLNNVTLSHNIVGFRVATSGSVNGLTVTGGHFDNNVQGLYTTATAGRTNNQIDFTNISFDGTTFDNNSLKGIYVEKLDHATFANIEVVNSGTSGISSSGIDINEKYGVYSTIELLNVTVTGSGVGDPASGTGIAIKGRNDGSYAGNPASLTGVTLDNVAVSGSPIDLSIGNNTSGVSFNDVTLGGAGRGLVLWTIAPQSYDLGNTGFAVGAGQLHRERHGLGRGRHRSYLRHRVGARAWFGHGPLRVVRG